MKIENENEDEKLKIKTFQMRMFNEKLHMCFIDDCEGKKFYWLQINFLIIYAQNKFQNYCLLFYIKISMIPLN